MTYVYGRKKEKGKEKKGEEEEETERKTLMNYKLP